MFSRQYDAVIWDWNGTLLDDVEISCELLNTMLSLHGYKELGELSAYREVFGFPISDYYLRAGFDFTRHPYNELAREYIPLYTAAAKACALAPHAREMLELFNKRDITQIILSASEQKLLASQLEQYEISQIFTDVCALNDCYAASKKDTGLKWISECGIPKERIVMIGDTEHDCETAHEMGIECILYAGGHSPISKLLATGCKVIKSLSELQALI